MTEDLNLVMDMTTDSMKSSVEHLSKELSKVRAGKAHPSMLDGINVSYYGSPTPLKQVASVNNQDGRTLVIKPWEKSMIAPIEKGIFAANLGVTPQNDGEAIRLTIPPLTESRRRDLVKKAKALGEDAKVSIRSARKEANKEIKGLVKDGLSEDIGKNSESEIQDLTKKYSARIDELVKGKESEIMKI
ncbi:MAG: ribosome recycling factor [Chitinophagales bacterium]